MKENKRSFVQSISGILSENSKFLFEERIANCLVVYKERVEGHSRRSVVGGKGRGVTTRYLESGNKVVRFAVENIILANTVAGENS